jgi:mRNA interferase MazF
MIHPKSGEVYWVDLGLKAKFRPVIVVSREDPNSERALAVCVPCTTEKRGGNDEVPLPRVRWMPGSDQGVANVHGITSIEHHRLERRAGRHDSAVVNRVRKQIAWMLEIP